MSKSMVTFTNEQVIAYFDRIRLPTAYRDNQQGDLPAPTTELLFALHAYHISSCPYENLTIHYSPSRRVSIGPQDLFDKIVSSGQSRGGYCLENSLLFNRILATLGYTVYTAPAKRRPRLDGLAIGDYIGWVHMVNVVTVADSNGVQRQYAVDVAFGGDGPRCPLELVEEAVTPNIGTQELRLTKSHLPDPAQTDAYVGQLLTDGRPAANYWNYQYRNKPEHDWNTFYSFPEFEFSWADFEVINWATSTAPWSNQVQNVLIVLFMRNEEGQIVGKRTLANDTVKRFPTASGASRSEVVEVFKSEEERVAGIEKWFHIRLSDEQRRSIHGWQTELKAER